MPDNGSLADKIVPARHAARRAAANFADQLMSSPEKRSRNSRSRDSSSDLTELDTSDSSTMAILSPRKKGTASKRYGGIIQKRKKAMGQTSAPSNAPTSDQLKDSFARKRRRSLSQLSDDSGMGDFPQTTKKIMPRNISKAARAKASTSDKPSFKKSKRSRRMPQPANSSDGHTTSSLSRSPSPSFSKPQFSSRTPPSSSSQRTPDEIPAATIVPPRQRRIAEAGTFHSVHQIIKDTWSLARLGTSVWVRIDESGAVVAEGAQSDMDEDVEQFWWPARIRNSEPATLPLRVSFYGNFPSSSTNTTTAILSNPSPKNVLPMSSPRGGLLFNSTTFTPSQAPLSVQSSPRKPRHQQSTLELRWKEAVDEMVKADQDANDGLPNTLFAYNGGTFGDVTPPRHSRELADGDSTDESLSEAETERWSPPPPDELLEIPGELVLAREKRQKTVYWPARLVRYVPPPRRDVQPKYEVEYLDGAVKQITRDLFYSSDEPEFATCELGQFESSVSLEDAEIDIDDARPDDIDMATLFGRCQSPRSSSPPPNLPAPSRVDFCNLPIVSQLAYAKPILSLLLACEYEPAKERHASFMKGGQAKQNTCRTAAGMRGGLTASEVGQLQNHLIKWFVRQEMRVTSGAEAQDQSRPDRTGLQISENNDDDSSSEIALASTASEAHGPPSSIVTNDDPMDDDPMDGALTPTPSSPHPPFHSHDDPQFANVPKNHVEMRFADPPALYSPLQEHIGSAFKDLSGVEQVEYCTNVLLPEAIIQLMLWRWERRTSLQPEESDEAERQLYEFGLEKAEETDWVHTIMHLRKQAESRLSRKATAKSGKKKAPSGLAAGTHSRPRRYV